MSPMYEVRTVLTSTDQLDQAHLHYGIDVNGPLPHIIYTCHSLAKAEHEAAFMRFLGWQVEVVQLSVEAQRMDELYAVADREHTGGSVT